MAPAKGVLSSKRSHELVMEEGVGRILKLEDCLLDSLLVLQKMVTHKLLQKPLKAGARNSGPVLSLPCQSPSFPLCPQITFCQNVGDLGIFFKKLSWHHCQINHHQFQHLPVTLKPRDPVLRAVLQIFLMLPVCQVLLEIRGSAPLLSQAPASPG